MADTKPAVDPQPQPAPEPEKRKLVRGIFNETQQNALDKASLIVTAARKAEYAAVLAEGGITAEFVNQLQTDVAACKESVGRANELSIRVRSATEAETRAQADLLAAIREIQTRAKQKYARCDAQKMDSYFIGRKIGTKRAAILQIADSIAGKLAEDTLPGITPAKVADLKALRDAYSGANAAQIDAQSKVTAERVAIDAAVQSITDRRIQIQFAAEAEWPARNEANAPMRREFQLPPDRPFIG